MIWRYILPLEKELTKNINKISNILYDDTAELGLDDVTKDNFEDSFADMSLSPCMLSRTMGNAEEVDDSESDNEDFQPQAKKETPPNKEWQIDLVTYLCADVLKVSSRENFANIVCVEFKLRLTLKLNHDVDVDFQTWHDYYYSAFTYVTKFDTHYVTSKNHPVLSNPPNTTKATAAKRSCPLLKESITKNPQKTYKPPRLLPNQVGEIIRINNLKTDIAIYAFTKKTSKWRQNWFADIPV